MSRKVLPIKIPQELIDEIDATVARFVHTRREAPISRNAFIERAIQHELDHLKRSRQRRSRKALDAICVDAVIAATAAESFVPRFRELTKNAVAQLAADRRESRSTQDAHCGRVGITGEAA